MLLAAIDIGSNAIRLQIIRGNENKGKVSFKKLEFIRFPLRLGKDAFTQKEIQKSTLEKFEKLMRTFKLMIDLYEVDHYFAVATSAMREAKNGKAIINSIATYFNLKIDIISGDLEAEILSKAIIPYLDDKNYIHIDVGGGSTELNFYVNKKRIKSRSFKVGSVRNLNEAKSKQLYKQITTWVNGVTKKFSGPIIGIGTGGNINKLFKLSNQKYNGSVSLTELKGMQAYVSQYSYDERIKFLNMNPDRADVILPASNIYIKILSIVGADQILVPGAGLKDGLLYSLYERSSKKSIKEVVFVGLD